VEHREMIREAYFREAQSRGLPGIFFHTAGGVAAPLRMQVIIDQSAWLVHDRRITDKQAGE
jgi:hypothetical protein